MALEYAITCVPAFEFLKRPEWITFDWRVLLAQKTKQPESEKLGFVYVDDDVLADAKKKKVKLEWPFPRYVHGVNLKELTMEEAAWVAYDIFFAETRAGQAPLLKPGQPNSSDAVFAQEIAWNGHVLLGASGGPLHSENQLILPDPLFSRAAAGVGHACSHLDGDGIMRRVKPFIEPKDHTRIWQLGLLLAAKHLDLDLDKAKVDAWSIRVPDKAGRIHEIPLDGEGNLLIRWTVNLKYPESVVSYSFSKLLGAATIRSKTGSVPSEPFNGRLVLVGTIGGNPSIDDRGASPLGALTPFCSVHFNVANAVLTQSFVQATSLPLRMGIISLLVAMVGWISWKLRAPWATVAAVAVVSAYLIFTFLAYIHGGWWLPVAVPVLGSVCVTHSVMVLYRFYFERSHRRRLRGVFSHLLSPDALELLLQQPQVSWAPQERVMTVFFADIRGFTAFTDDAGRHAGVAAVSPGEEPADKEVLETVNLYLSAVVGALERHGATLDKYMGDSVMAFWGAPLEHPGHAATAVRAAVDAQNAIQQINHERDLKNQGIAQLNEEYASRGLPLQPPLRRLALGMGLNTGMMTVGFMGAETHLSNYTVFGRAVNIASRLQGAASGGQIYVTEETRESAIAASPQLAAAMLPLGLLTLKGIAEPVPAYEVACSAESFSIRQRD